MILDPIWESGAMKRKEVYAHLTKALGWKYHTAQIRSIEEARRVYRLILNIRTDLTCGDSTKQKGDLDEAMA